MSWTDIKSRYENAGGSASQSTEDMVARRILRVIGVTEARLPRIEHEKGLDLNRRPDTTLLERAIALAHLGCRAFYPPPPVIDIKTPREAESALLEFAEVKKSVSDKPAAVIYRKSGDPSIRALIDLGSDTYIDMDKIPVPCRITKSRDGSSYLADCDSRDYIAKVLGREQPEHG